MKQELTAARLRELLHYDPETGIFTRRIHASPSARAGDQAGSTSARGYRTIVVDGRAMKEHRLAWLYMTGRWPKDQIDHQNRVRSDNRWSNLREATNAENQQNIPRKKNNSSGFTGASWHRAQRKWAARITVDGKIRTLGYYDDPAQAGAVYAEAKRKLHVFAQYGNAR